MPLDYSKLFKLLIDRRITRTEFREGAGLSSLTVSKFFRGENMNTENILRVCAYLGVQPGDIMEYVPGEEPPEPPKPKERKDRETKSEAKSETGSEENKNGGGVNSLKMTESQIIQAKYGVNIEEMELPDGYVKLQITDENGEPETVIVSNYDHAFFSGQEQTYKAYIENPEKRVMGENMLNDLYTRLRAKSCEYLKEISKTA